MAKQEKLTIADEGGNEIVIPSKYEVCGRCEGHGVHDHPAFDNGFTSSEWHEMDEESRDQYMAGAYDVQCSCCHGTRVELVPDYDRLTDEQKTMLRANEEADREMRAIQRMERLMEC